MNKIFALVITLFLFTLSVKSQKVVFIFSAPEGEEILKINEDLHEKSVDFFVSGLATVDEVSALVQNITAVYGVKSFTVSEVEQDGKRAASAVFDGCASLVFFKKLLVDAGVLDLVINGEPLKTADLHLVWKSQLNQEDPTKPMHNLE